ncbi:MAG: hypothetical protein GYB68_19595, partial [Chloroflexi bacterium]|nr:hypothetical protein [Chloroflexota bacterium]
MDLVIVALLPFVLALIAPNFVREFGRKPFAWLLGAVALGQFAWMTTYIPVLIAEGPLSLTLPWAPSLGLSLSIYLDGLSLLMTLVVTGAASAIMLYTGHYFEEDDPAAIFYLRLLMFMSAMLGLVLVGNVLLLFICWELTSILSFLLIGFKGKYEASRAAGMQALVVTGAGGLALLVGLLLLGGAAGSYELRDILAAGDVLRAHPWYPAITILVILGAFTKSAQFPFHFWLPTAKEAPTPASSFLHAATMVKAGVYLLARMYPALGETALWETVLISFGLFTFVMGGALGLRHTDLKTILAYSTVSQLGAFVFLIGLPESIGLKAAFVGIAAHAMYKGTMFLIAGTVDHSVGTRDLSRLGGLAPHMPVLASIAVIVGLSKAGVPPLLGFVAKETLIEAGLEVPFLTGLITVAVVTGATLSVALTLVFVIETFFGKMRDEELHIHRPEAGILTGQAVLAAASIVFGLFVTDLMKPLIQFAVGEEIKLVLFPGFNLAFGLSMTALAVGGGIYALRGLRDAWTRIPLPSASDAFWG